MQASSLSSGGISQTFVLMFSALRMLNQKISTTLFIFITASNSYSLHSLPFKHLVYRSCKPVDWAAMKTEHTESHCKITSSNNELNKNTLKFTASSWLIVYMATARILSPTRWNEQINVKRNVTATMTNGRVRILFGTYH